VAPSRKKRERPMRTSAPPSAGSANSTTNAIAAKTAKVLNWRVRKADAPSCTACAMVCMLVVPSPAASTCVRNIIPIANAMTAMTPTTTTNVRLPPDRSTAFPPPASAAKMCPDIRPPQLGSVPVRCV
jgi:hypothetical protein